MRIEIDIKKSLYENAADYYERSKKFKKKIDRLKKEIEKTKKELTLEGKKEKKTLLKLKKKEKREWYEKFRYLFIDDFLVIGGRDQRQNEILVSRYMRSNDLFLHADIHGAPVVIVKNGQEMDKDKLMQAVRFAACYSTAWHSGFPFVGVFCVKPNQVFKAVSGQYVAKGSFVIKGKRDWFKGVPLRFFLLVSNKITQLFRDLSNSEIQELRKQGLLIQLSPGERDKKALINYIKMFASKRNWSLDLDEIHRIIPQRLDWVIL